MDYKGYCLWASDVPAAGVPHYMLLFLPEEMMTITI